MAVVGDEAGDRMDQPDLDGGRLARSRPGAAKAVAPRAPRRPRVRVVVETPFRVRSAFTLAATLR